MIVSGTQLPRCNRTRNPARRRAVEGLPFDHSVLVCDLEHSDPERLSDCRGYIERAGDKGGGHDDGGRSRR